MTCASRFVGVCLLSFVALAPRALAQRPAPAAGSAALVVTVTTDDTPARPLRRAQVSLQAGELGVPRTVVTGDDGRAVFTELPVGNYLVSASKPGSVRAFYGSRTPGAGPGIAVALIDAQRMNLKLTVLRGAAISGMVRTPAGRPAAEIRVQAVNDRLSRSRQTSFFGDGMMNTAVTDDRGVYRIYGLPPGGYLVAAQPPSGSQSQEVSLTTAQELQWASRLTGASVPVEAPGPPRAGSPLASAPVYHPGTPDAGAAAVVMLGAGEERLGVDIALQFVPTAHVRGRLIDASGRPQANQNITLRSIQSGVQELVDVASLIGGSARTAADGSFVLTGVRPGRYTVSARGSVSPPPPPRPEAGTDPQQAAMQALAAVGLSGSHWASEDIAVNGVDITDVTLLLRPGMTVTGRVIYEGTTLAKPQNLTSLMFMLMPDVGSAGAAAALVGLTGSVQIRVAEDGTFSASGVTPGRYRFQTQASMLAMAGAAEAMNRSGWVLKSAIVRGHDIADAPLEIVAGSDVSGLIVTFTDRPTELSGTVFDAAGRVTADFPIIVFSTDRAYWTANSRRVRVARPATDGLYRITGLPAGEYFVCAVTAIEPDQLSSREFLEQLGLSSFKIVLTDGERRAQDLKLDGGSPLFVAPRVQLNPSLVSSPWTSSRR